MRPRSRGWRSLRPRLTTSWATKGGSGWSRRRGRSAADCAIRRQGLAVVVEREERGAGDSQGAAMGGSQDLKRKGFRVSARTLLQLGGELISSDGIAFYELIKNAVDAGSSKAFVEVVIRLPFEIVHETTAMLRRAEASKSGRDK